MDYKLARFEKLIDDRGKTNEFRSAYEDITGTPWVDDRESYDMFGEEVAEAANRACGMSIKSVTDWADSSDAALDEGGCLRVRFAKDALRPHARFSQDAG